MSRTLKALGLALVAALALTAAASSFASANQFHSEIAETVLTGSQEGTDVFTTDAGTVSCNEATYVGSQTGATTTEASVSPSYSECTAFGFLSVPIDSSPCKYRFHAGETEVTKKGEEVIGSHLVGSTDIYNCERITVTAPGCTVTVFPQTGLKRVVYKNIGTGEKREITVEVNIAGIQYEEHNKGFFPTCNANTVKKSNGTYKGSTVVKGETGAGVQKGIWVE